MSDMMIWTPIDVDVPKDNRYVLLSFSNFDCPLVGRYEEDKDGKGGAFYVGDDMDPAVKADLFVNAWMPLPACYCDED